MKVAAWALLMLIGFLAPAFGQTRPITIDVRDADLQDVITLLAAESGVNIVADDSLKAERVTLHLQGVSADAALQVLAESRGLQLHRIGNVLVIGSAENMRRRFPAVEGVQGIQAVGYDLQNTDALDLAKELEPNLPPDALIIADKQSRRIVVRASQQTQAQARELITANRSKSN